mmetsp:Transcript_12412/g.30429  ORF Transcript_12412/g.30429 Transcript_12412/m.30429 type:complete len:284 (-) Transcript_12412:380-1231(-)
MYVEERLDQKARLPQRAPRWMHCRGPASSASSLHMKSLHLLSRGRPALLTNLAQPLALFALGQKILGNISSALTDTLLEELAHTLDQEPAPPPPFFPGRLVCQRIHDHVLILDVNGTFALTRCAVLPRGVLLGILVRANFRDLQPERTGLELLVELILSKRELGQHESKLEHASGWQWHWVRHGYSPLDKPEGAERDPDGAEGLLGEHRRREFRLVDGLSRVPVCAAVHLVSLAVAAHLEVHPCVSVEIQGLREKLHPGAAEAPSLHTDHASEHGACVLTLSI